MNILKILEILFGSKQTRDLKRLRPILEQVNSFRQSFAALSDAELREKTAQFRTRLANGETLDELLPEAFSAVREATHRVLGERRKVTDQFTQKEISFMAHFDVQVLGGISLHQGKIAEMRTGEGKTQVATLAAYLNALTGKGVHVITVNDYLAKRDSEWMGRIFGFLGLTTGCLDKTEPGTPERRAAYCCDITYGTNNEFGFDYLRDNMAVSAAQCVQRELNFAVIDEVDNILVDEARTPLIISGPVTKSNDEYEELRPRVQKLVDTQSKLITKVMDEAEKLLEQPGKETEAGFKLMVVKRGAPKTKKLVRLQKETGPSKFMKQVETDYLRERKLHEIDEELYYVLDESGHSAELTEQGRLLISGSNPDFFIVPDLSELLGDIDADESTTIEEKIKKRDDAHRFHAERSERIHCISQLLRAFSLFERDVDYVVQEGKILIVDEFTGRILHGRRYSEGLHQALEAKENVTVAGENQTLATITFQNFFKMYNKIAGMTGTAATEAGEFNEIYKLDVSTMPTNRPMVRNDFDDEIYRTNREKYNAIVKDITDHHAQGRPVLVGTTSIEKSELIGKLLTRSGVEHEVLNAKQHAKEATIVAQAGRLGSVTIATNMAGRGTDIVLGGNFEIMANHELIKEGVNPTDLVIEDKRIKYAKLFKELQEEHIKVKELGGLHIIGTERHESRRIDNQLRGRAGRQGDPGSSKFFLSLDDDLMRIFGSERLAGIFDKLGLKEGEVISHGLVSRSIENAQKRVEGRNFEIRKHLKDYDDVMNLQRTEIYGMRQSILKGEDIRDMVFDQIAAFIEDAITKATGSEKYSESWDLKNLVIQMQSATGIAAEFAKTENPAKDDKELFDLIWHEVKQRYEEKEQRYGTEFTRRFERGVFLMVIDNLWKEHLYEMDQLKQAVQFRSYGQKNPLYEYRREALLMFEQLMGMISRDLTSYLFRLEAVNENEDRMGLQRARTVHTSIEGFGGSAQPQQQSAPQQMITSRGSEQTSSAGRPGAPAAAPRTPVRVAPVAGRNDPCPCGSGKKYKKCHGVGAG